MQIYLVGGAVRDTLLNYPVYDRDWVVVGASAQEMLDLGYQPVGQDFPVFIHPDSGEEYALARTERKSGKGYTGFQYHADESVTLEQDLQRRDLTINAMAMDDQSQLFDPYNGQQDLNNKILRHVSPAFSEDPLRVLRVARFAARYHHLGFLIAPETLTLMTELAAGDELEHLTPERVWKEFERALSERSPHIFLEVLKQTQALNKVLPELDQSQATTSAGLLRFQQLCLHSDLTLVRFACLIALTPNIATAAFCDRLHTPKAYKELALNCQQHHQNLAHFDQQSAEDKLAMIQQLDLIRRPQRLELLLCCVDALHPQQLSTKSLAPILDEIASIQPKALIAEGHQGAALGEAIAARRLQICQNHSGNNSNL